ncbi:hypothetical protein SULI_07590 [Saccharolobus solfataricus]|uniref:Uncharacterized protein n=3 Tax=Saccharolobus solfataricus TaxID=2287 RepID=Q97ZS9_SACS2|nr:hypothetical protein [Saccharolobus solfataricus]AAK40819.1 Hypothetical protein SSO0500 [Saccharolobus solfataricus P2]AKA73793.1 hypothetical protein SULB_1525 [Saccharolobus solfataricus]AKA76490.1 hypothetical protein SULC_1523 [Saccharolobus solfataricus]AKA79183.1 hypothetical protein SULA_1524 [Saccharolobus solfataricus]AZF68269.1 hypothetical protein SULG_07590 [Saccharolobus solfataricus]
MYTILAYTDTIVFNVIRKAAYENFCTVYTIRSYSPSKLVASVGNIMIIVSRNNKSATISVKCGNAKKSFYIKVNENRINFDGNEMDTNLFIYHISSIENELYEYVKIISEKCNMQEICHKQKKGIKEILVEGKKINIGEEIKHSLEQLLTILYKREVSVECSKSSLCIKKVILTRRKVYIQLVDSEKENYWYLELNDLINKMPEHAQEILNIEGQIRAQSI